LNYWPGQGPASCLKYFASINILSGECGESCAVSDDFCPEHLKTLVDRTSEGDANNTDPVLQHLLPDYIGFGGLPSTLQMLNPQGTLATRAAIVSVTQGTPELSCIASMTISTPGIGPESSSSSSSSSSSLSFPLPQSRPAIVAGPVLDPEEAKAAAAISKIMAVVHKNGSAPTITIPGLEGTYTKVELHGRPGRVASSYEFWQRSSGRLFDVELFRYLPYDMVKMSPRLVIVTNVIYEYKNEDGYVMRFIVISILFTNCINYWQKK
jgi:hypothetical protein